MGRGNRVFIICEGFDLGSFSRSIKDLTLISEAAHAPCQFDLLDCHDQSLRAGGRLLIDAGDTLQLMRDDGEILSQKGSGKGRFVQDLPDGPVRSALSGFPRLRALMSIGSGAIESFTFAGLDDLQKTQVRGRVMTLSSNDGQVTIAVVQPMQGYRHAFKTVCAALERVAIKEHGIAPVFQNLIPFAVPYQAKPKIRLEAEEPSIQVASDIIRSYLAVARQNEAGVIADTDTEFLHDYRVSLRRIRSVLSLFKGVFTPTQTAVLKQEFSDLMTPTGRVRDLDVWLLKKEQYFNLLPENLHAGMNVLFAQFAKERLRLWSELFNRFRSAPYEKQMNRLAAQFADTGTLHPGPDADRGAYDYARALIWKRYGKLCKQARRITPKTPDEAIHDLRIDCKKLRYLMEFFAPLFDSKAFKKIIKPLKKLQENLGLFNDCSVQQDALLRFVADQSNTKGRVDAQLALAVGGLIAVLGQKQKAERACVIASFQHFDSPSIQHLFHSLFHNPED